MVTRRLSAVMAADVAGYSRLMHEDEDATHAAFTAVMTRVIEPALARHRGRMVKGTGDGFLAEFYSAVDAVDCAIAFQDAMRAHGKEHAANQRIAFRVGVHIGDVIVEQDDLYGDGVNIAVRIESLAEPGGVLVSSGVQELVQAHHSYGFEDLGTHRVKNIARPIHVFRAFASDAKSEPHALPLPDKPSIVILPFQNLSGDPEQDYFTDGIVEDITTAISRFQSLFVIGRSSAFTYKGKAIDVRQIARELGVRYALNGSVRKSGNRVRIAGQLIRAETGIQLWGTHYDRGLDDVFAVQDEITASIVGALVPTLQRAELEQSWRKPPGTLDAYDLYLRALAAHREGTATANARAQELLIEALSLDPDFVPALVLAEACCSIGHRHGWMPQRETLEQSKRYLRRAIQLEPDNADALAALARHMAGNRRSYAEAITLAEQAVAANPNSCYAMRVSGMALVNAGRPERSLANFQAALRISPQDPQIFANWNGVAFALAELERYQEAVDAGRNALLASPEFCHRAAGVRRCRGARGTGR